MKTVLIHHCLLAIAALALTSFSLSADTLELRNGSTLKGSYEGGTPDVVRFYFNGSTQEYNRGDIASITFSEETPNRPGTAAASIPGPIPAAPAEAPSAMTIPAGTNLVASLQGSINSGSVKAGETFPAILVSDLRVGNQVILPAGTQLQGEIVSAKSAGIIRKKADLVLTINAINYKGQMVAVRTSTQQESSSAETGKDVLGGAAKGAAMGAIFGAFNDGAGDGAAGGAVGGAAGGLLHKGDNVEYSSGSVLAFTLESPVNL